MTAMAQSAVALASCSCACPGHAVALRGVAVLTRLARRLCSALPEDAERAVKQKQSTLFMGRKLNVELANQRQPLKTRAGALPGPSASAQQLTGSRSVQPAAAATAVARALAAM